MLAVIRRRVLPVVAVLLAAVGTAPAADAGWVTFQNNTGRVVVVQTTVGTSNQPRRNRPVRLLPGEHLREFHATPSVQVEVFDGQPQDRSLFHGTLTLRSDPQTFLMTPAGRGITVAPAGGR